MSLLAAPLTNKRVHTQYSREKERVLYVSAWCSVLGHPHPE